ncbi:hypothetical protein HPB51_001773 [Rhipicephalus microplus]|uniref:Uncharacterized protein n=1 Tax=Rhipicephalus microplus TaxID=6941 RepID=A0A9J6E5P3_RHIMP|nr:hypothetical protein HPB51_001773 [Rhipicephalus microplus]
MDTDDFEPTDNVGPSNSTPGPSGGVAEVYNNTYLRPSGPHTPWFLVIDARRKKVVAEEASATPPATFHQREHRLGTGRPCLPRLSVEDHWVIFHIRGGISLQQKAVLPLRAAIRTTLRAPEPMSARIRVRKEQNIALVSTSDPDLAVQLCHVQTLKLGSRSYQVSAYVASPDNSCKGVITGALPIPTEDALMTTPSLIPKVSILSKRDHSGRMEHASTPSRESVFPDRFTSKAWNFYADLADPSPKCATAASELATDTTSAYIHKNAGEEIVAFSTKVNTTMVASRGD